MPAVLLNPMTLLNTAGPPTTIASPLSDSVSQVRYIAINSSSRPSHRVGVWECTPGRWRRQVTQAEFCHFLSGRATFTPDDGPALEIAAGDVVHFPECSLGVWDIHETCRKIFIVFDEGIASEHI